jgi:uncharacterized membrane protein YkoI
MTWRLPDAPIAALAGLAVAAMTAVAAMADPPPHVPDLRAHHEAARPPNQAAQHPAAHAAEPAARHPPARPKPPARRHRHSGCVSQRGMIAIVQARRAVPLTAIRAEAERRGNGEIIGARLCHREDGRLVYLVSVLSEGGKVVHLGFDAASGRAIVAAR